MTASSRQFIDTNVVVYAFTEDPRNEMALALLAKGYIISVQVLNEFANVARRKLRMDWKEVGESIASIRSVCSAILPLDVETHTLALKVAEQHGLSFFDALLIAAALQGGCEKFLSEDLHDGLVVDSRLRIENPFRGAAS
jgi:predicted nucleic acid-binding protein